MSLNTCVHNLSGSKKATSYLCRYNGAYEVIQKLSKIVPYIYCGKIFQNVPISDANFFFACIAENTLDQTGGPHAITILFKKGI